MENYDELTDGKKARALEILRKPEVREEIIQRLSLRFTPEVMEEIRKINQRHAEEWPKHAGIFYSGSAEKYTQDQMEFAMMMERDPELYKLISRGLEVKFDEKACDEIEKTRRAHLKISPCGFLKPLGAEMANERGRISRALSKAGYDFQKAGD